MVMTQVVLVLSPLPAIRCAKHDGVMRLNILWIKVAVLALYIQITSPTYLIFESVLRVSRAAAYMWL